MRKITIGGEFTVMSNNYKKLYRVLLRLQSLGFDVVIRIQHLF